MVLLLSKLSAFPKREALSWMLIMRVTDAHLDVCVYELKVSSCKTLGPSPICSLELGSQGPTTVPYFLGRFLGV